MVRQRLGSGVRTFGSLHQLDWNSRWFEDRFSKLYDRRPMVVKLSDRVEVEWFRQISPIGCIERDEVAVSGIGTMAAARNVVTYPAGGRR